MQREKDNLTMKDKQYDISEEQYQRDLRLVGYYLRRFSGRSDAPDVLHELYSKRLEFPDRHQNIKWFVLDYLRKNSGRKRSSSYAVRCALERSFNETEERALENIQSPVAQPNMGTRFISERLFGFIKSPRKREIAIMVWILDMEQTEVAVHFNISAGRVNQIIKDIKKDLIYHLSKQTVVMFLDLEGGIKEWLQKNYRL